MRYSATYLLPDVSKSLDELAFPDEADSPRFGDAIQSPDPSPEDALIMREQVRNGLRLMSIAERQVLRLRAEGLTLEEIGSRFGRSREYIRQIEYDGRQAARGGTRQFGRHRVPLTWKQRDESVLQRVECGCCRKDFQQTKKYQMYCSSVCKYRAAWERQKEREGR